ncbi:MAG: hypothetical protein BWX80_04145 [Candidatus Hydrogenedentes bacterium ADurb.Bin101]|nr:MAG: hypothetical protein BWX80_04145 [Candidatus Hydrogenedentes bacterium ADurb.Bin101]
MRRDTRDGDGCAVEIHIHKIAGNRAGSVGTVTFRIFRGHKVGRSVVSIAPGADDFVITGGRVVRVAGWGAHAQVIASPFVHIAVIGSSAEGRMVKVDAAIQDANQNAFALGADRIGNSRAVPNIARANPLGTRVGGVGVGLVFQDFANAGQALQVFGFLRGKFHGDAIQNHVIDIADFDGTPKQAFSLGQHGLAIDCQAVQVVPAFQGVDVRAAFRSGERSAFEEHDVARHFGFVDDVALS